MDLFWNHKIDTEMNFIGLLVHKRRRNYYKSGAPNTNSGVLGTNQSFLHMSIHNTNEKWRMYLEENCRKKKWTIYNAVGFDTLLQIGNDAEWPAWFVIYQ